MTRGPIVYFGPLSCFLPYNSTALYLYFPFIGGWYSYSRSYIRCGSCFFTIITKNFGIKVFSAISEVCNLVSIGVGPLYIISS
jgi:hypothetical protein